MKAKCLFLGGLCLVAFNWSHQISAMDAAVAPRNYRQLIADSDVAKAVRDKLNLESPLAVSQLRPSVLTQPGDWTACVRVSSAGFKTPFVSGAAHGVPAQRQPALAPLKFYAFFFANGAIVDSRPAVIIDRCADMTYSPLPQPSKMKKPDGDAGASKRHVRAIAR